MMMVVLQNFARYPPQSFLNNSKRQRAPTSSHTRFLQFHACSHIHLSTRPNLQLSIEHRTKFQPIRATGTPDQVSGGGKEAGESSSTVDWCDWVKPLSKFIGSNFLPLALVSGVILGVVNPSLGCLAHSYSLSKYSTFGIFIISGLMLKTEEIRLGLEAWPAGTYGLISILLVTPFLSKLILNLQMIPQEFVNGLAMFCCMPTSLSSGVTLTQLVGGNFALALAMTLLSNILGILLIPLSLSSYISGSAGVPIPAKKLFQSLIFTLLIPLIFGKVLREFFSNIAQYVDKNRSRFSMLNAILLSLVPWMQVSKSKSLLLGIKPASFLVAITLGIFIHLAFLAINSLAMMCLSGMYGEQKSVFSKKENARAVIIIASQKTLPVMVAVVEQLGGALGDSGLLVLPCIAAHLIQIVIDSFLVKFWIQRDRLSTLRSSS